MGALHLTSLHIVQECKLENFLDWLIKNQDRTRDIKKNERLFFDKYCLYGSFASNKFAHCCRI